FGVPPVPAILMGIITGCVGGIIRDVLAGQPSILMRPELYVTAAALASALCAAGSLLALPALPVWLVATSCGFALRGAAIHWGLSIPTYGRAGDQP
ncbi:MAG: TRIC cation channel family protein, partial [Novosphingobium sp.]|nr:TRIC cation channel family protein [Novosphingobium sp.]